MTPDRTRLRRVQQLLLRLAAELEAPPSRARARALARLRAQLRNLRPEALRAPTRRSVRRDLARVEAALAGRSSTATQLEALAGAMRWFGTRHPVLLTLILLLLIIVLAWRQNFVLTTKLGSAEIRIEGMRDGVAVP